MHISDLLLVDLGLNPLEVGLVAGLHVGALARANSDVALGHLRLVCVESTLVGSFRTFCSACSLSVHRCDHTWFKADLEMACLSVHSAIVDQALVWRSSFGRVDSTIFGRCVIIVLCVAGGMVLLKREIRLFEILSQLLSLLTVCSTALGPRECVLLLSGHTINSLGAQNYACLFIFLYHGSVAFDITHSVGTPCDSLNRVSV